MGKHEVRDDLRYTKDHEWLKVDGDEVIVGVTAYAVDQLGDITLVNIDVGEGDELEAAGAFGTVESVKTLADLFAPIGGKVVRINDELEDQPELVNMSCYDKAWMIALTPADPAEIDGLLDAAQYRELLATL